MSRRHLLTLALVGLAGGLDVAGCSYGWTIGEGGTSGGSSSSSSSSSAGALPPSPGDANVNLDAGSPLLKNECGPSCTCKDNQDCNFVCTTGSCAIDCSRNSTCKLTCGSGATCAVTCKDNASCQMDCSAGGSKCALTCTDEATCKGTCKALSVCTRDCRRKCSLDCSGGALCPQ